MENMETKVTMEEEVDTPTTEVVATQSKSGKVAKAAIGIGAAAIIGGLIYKGFRAICKSNEIIEAESECIEAAFEEVDEPEEEVETVDEEDDENESEIEES